jgi:transposase
MRLRSFFRKIFALARTPRSIVVEGDRIEVEIPTNRVERCGECRRPARRRHGQQGKRRRWHHLSLYGYAVSFVCVMYRVFCRTCGVRTMHVPWARRGSVFTRQFENEVAWFLQRSDQTTTSRYFDISWVTAGKIARRVVDEHTDGSVLENLRWIGVDEISYGRPRKFMTVVVDHDRQRVIWAAEGKTSATLRAFFEAIDVESRKQIAVVTMDMSKAFTRAVEEHLPGAEIVYDRYHVARLIIDALDEVRRNQIQRARTESTRRALTNSRFPLLKNPWNLRRYERSKLADVQRVNQPVYRAYLLKETALDLYNSATTAEADRRFEEWFSWARRSRLRPFQRLAATLREYWPRIRRFIELGLTNARVEGYNSKIRMISHRAFGFHSGPAVAAMLKLCCSGIAITPMGHRVS